MEEFIELYSGETLKLLGRKENMYGPILTLKIYLHDFSGTGMFYLSEDDLKVYIDNIDFMNTKLKGNCIIKDNESTNYCRIFFEERAFWIEGSFSLYGDETLTFKVEADQTILEPIIKLLKS